MTLNTETPPSGETTPGGVEMPSAQAGRSLPSVSTDQNELLAALAYAATGLAIFPCRNAPGQDGHKAPLTPRGFKDASTDPARIRAWWAKHPRALIGMPTGAINGIAVLDLDKKNGKDGFAAVPGWETLSPVRSQTGGGGAHVFFQAHRAIRSATGSDGVDVRAEGGYVIMPGSQGYSWPMGVGPINPRALPPFPDAFAPSFHSPDPSDDGQLAEEPELVGAALRVIPNADENWDEWNRMGMAVWAATGGDDDGFDAWDEWSRQSTKYSIYETRARWDHFRRSPPSQIGFGSLFYMACETDPDWLTKFELEREAAARVMFEEGQAAFLDMAGTRQDQPSPEPAPSAAETSETAGEDGAEHKSETDAGPTPEEPSSTADSPSSRLLGEWDAGSDFGSISPRAWLLGNTFCRKYVSSLIADGGVGKTALRYAQALACATGRKLTGEHVFQRSRVLIMSLEDDREELRRRLRAAMLTHGITPEDLKGWLFLSAPGGKAGKLVKASPRGGRVTVGPMLDELKAAIIGRKIDLLIIDPLVKAHDVEENDNSAMDIVISTLAELAIAHNIAVDVLHHTSKGAADPGNADRGRGASAVKNGARLVYTLTPMSVDEARLFGVNEAARRSYVRLDSGKVNITPALDRANWFELVGVDLGNGNALYPNGDSVQTVKQWFPPDVWGGVSDDTRRRILDEIEDGVPGDAASGREAGSRYSNNQNATWRAAWPVVAQHVPDLSEPQARRIVNDWLKTKVLVEREYRDPNDRRKVKGLYRPTKKDDEDVPM